MKKKVNFQPSPCRPACINDAAAASPMDDSKDQMKAYDDAFHRQILFNFSERRGAEKKNALETGRISRSVDVDLDHNAQAYNVETTDHRELSRYVLEDMLRTRQDGKLLVLVDKSAEEYSGSPKDAATSQRKSGLGGEDIRISGRMYHCLKAPP